MACRRTALSLLLASGSSASFLPFADVEELKPARLEPFCEPAQGQDGYRWCSRSIRKTLEDGGDVVMDWKLHVNPDSILSLDTEAEHGVRVTKCSDGELELELPETHEKYAVAGKFIIGSHFVHGCGHLTDKHMYHKVKEVKGLWRSAEGGKRTCRVKLATETLPHMAHIARHISYNFSYMPIEARDITKFPEMRTDFGHNREYLKANKEAKERKLQGFTNPFASLLNGAGNNFQSGGQANGGISTQNGLLNLSPKQVSNFGWNWNFFVNDTQTPRYTIDKPGTKGSFVIKQPFVKAHAGCFLNFSSNFEGGVLASPHVVWQAGFKGHGAIQGRIEGAMNSTRSFDLDPEEYKFPLQDKLPFLEHLKEFEQPKWFSGIQHSVGNMPMSVEPGFQFQLKLYHKGPFSGFLAFGGSTHGTIEPVLHFDSKLGFWNSFKGELLDTDLWPPMWMVFTKTFEFGVQANPKILLKGDFMGFSNAEAAINIRPYMNITVQRQGKDAIVFDADAKKAFTIYPMRVMGIDQLNMNTKYQVNISALGTEMNSAAVLNWGQVEFHDKLSTFNAGSFKQSQVKNQPISITLNQVQDGQSTIIGQGSFMCQSFVQGVCSPTPAFVSIKNPAGEEQAVVEISVALQNSPEVYFANQIKGIGISFPKVSINVAEIKAQFPDLASSILTTPLTLHFIQGGRTYLSSLAGATATGLTNLTGKNLIEVAPSFMTNWAPCEGVGNKCHSPRVQILSGSTLIGEAAVPKFAQPPAVKTGFLAALQGSSHNTPSPTLASEKILSFSASLTSPKNPSIPVGKVDFQARVTNPVESSLFMKPSFGSEVPLMGGTSFVWLVADATPSKVYYFKMTPMRITANVPYGTDRTQYRSIDNMILMPIEGASTTVDGSCTLVTKTGIPQSSAPCEFSKSLNFNSPTYTEGDQVTILLQWQEGGLVNGLTHNMYSPAIEIGSPSSTPTQGRRLFEPEDHWRLLHEDLNSRRLFNVHDPGAWTVNKSVDDSDQNCAQKDLHMNIGQGVLIRGEILSMGVPAGMQTSGFAIPVESDGAPQFATPWRSLGGPKEGKNAEDFLPKQLCEAGLCNSYMPGCREASFKNMHFPRLLFNFSRPYYYSNKTGKLIKTGMAWAFSAMPEAVTVMLKRMKEKEQAKAQAKAAAEPVYPWSKPAPAQQFGAPQQSNIFGSQQAQAAKNTFGNFFGGQQATQAQTAQPAWNFGGAGQQAVANNQFNTGTASSAAGGQANQWWNVQRRLEDGRALSVSQGTSAGLPAELEDHQAAVTFQGEGLPYKVSHELVSLMVRHGYFNLDDGHIKEMGPLHITGFYLEEGEIITVPVGGANDDKGSFSFIRDQASSLAIGFAVVCVASLAAFAVLRSKPHSGYLQTEAVNEDQSGLE
mmetsp:Transcript_22742/g.36574  ORF Transcript_22742/g.36574 Transcript_22742/m.36574 type:complete len:1388 (+) Transcript_22742:127-4290(+)